MTLTEPIVTALIAAVALILTALIALVGRVTIQINRVRKDAAVTREQVANDHTTNLRVEQDDRHDENTRRLEELTRKVDAGFETMTLEFRALWGKAGSNADRIGLLEQNAIAYPPATRVGRHREETP